MTPRSQKMLQRYKKSWRKLNFQVCRRLSFWRFDIGRCYVFTLLSCTLYIHITQYWWHKHISIKSHKPNSDDTSIGWQCDVISLPYYLHNSEEILGGFKNISLSLSLSPFLRGGDGKGNLTSPFFHFWLLSKGWRPCMHLTYNFNLYMTGNARWQSRRFCYKAVFNVSHFDALVPTDTLVPAIEAVVTDARYRHAY